jgi:hypothetical protein
MSKRLHHKLLFLFYACVLSPLLVLSQGLACPDLVNNALEALNEFCEELGRNQVCYGHEQVRASFITEVDADFFNAPSSTAPVAELSTLVTSPLNTEAGTWGLAMMNIQANLPNTLPGQNVTFILLGDVELENAVSPESAFQPIDGLEFVVNAPSGANLRSGPSQSFNVTGGLPNGARFIADGLSPDAQWLRLVHENSIAWIERALVGETGNIDTLPTLTNEQVTPMQAFYLRTGIGQEACVESPDNFLLIQGPENIEVSLTVNGAEVKLGSTGALRVLEQGGQPFLEVNVLEGEFVVDDVPIEAGERSLVCLGDENSRGLDGENNDLVVTCPPSEPEAIPPAAFDEAWCGLEIPSELLNYALEACYPKHTISSGETLFSIAEAYCTTVDAIVALNNITNANLIQVGQVLYIPLASCEGGTPARLPTATPVSPTTTAEVTPELTPEVTETPSDPCSLVHLNEFRIVPEKFTVSWTPEVGGDYTIWFTLVDAFFHEMQEWTEVAGTSFDFDGSSFQSSKGLLLVNFYYQGKPCGERSFHYFDFDPSLENFEARLVCNDLDDGSRVVGVEYAGSDGNLITIAAYSETAFGSAGSDSYESNAPRSAYYWYVSTDDYIYSVVVSVDGVEYTELGSCPPSQSQSQ